MTLQKITMTAALMALTLASAAQAHAVAPTEGSYVQHKHVAPHQITQVAGVCAMPLTAKVGLVLGMPDDWCAVQEPEARAGVGCVSE